MKLASPLTSRPAGTPIRFPQKGDWKVLLPVLVFLSILVFPVICLFRQYPAPLNQPAEEVVRIELIDDRFHNESVVCTVGDAEIEEFMERVNALKFMQYVNDPPTENGYYQIRIHYRDGYYDILGSDINSYCTAEGESARGISGWFCPDDRDAFLALIEAYAGMDFAVPVHQPFQNIERVEFVDARPKRGMVFGTLEGEEARAFFTRLADSVEYIYYENDLPQKLNMRVYYTDGHYDEITIEEWICFSAENGLERQRRYCSPRDPKKLLEVISQYVDEVPDFLTF